MGGWLAIVNPNAGAFRHGGFRSRWMPLLEPLLASVQYTRAQGEAAELARAASGYEGIAVIGGDGTLFEVISALEGRDHRLALIPAGRGNCLALDLGISAVRDAIAALTRGRSTEIDLLQVDTVFANGERRSFRVASTLATGYVADVVKLAGRFTLLGRHAYAAATLCVRPRARDILADYNGAGQRRARTTGVIINNTRHLANFHAFPHASVSDAFVDVLELRSGRAGQLLHNISILSRTYFYNPAQELRTDSVRLAFPEPETLMLDGELFEDVAEIRVACMPSTLRIQCPADYRC